MRPFLEYPIYPVYFEELEGKSITAELKLPISRHQCVYYSPETEKLEKGLNEFTPSCNRNGTIFFKTNIVLKKNLIFKNLRSHAILLKIRNG